jgi:hypothetical protein
MFRDLEHRFLFWKGFLRTHPAQFRNSLFFSGAFQSQVLSTFGQSKLGCLAVLLIACQL